MIMRAAAHVFCGLEGRCFSSRAKVTQLAPKATLPLQNGFSKAYKRTAPQRKGYSKRPFALVTPPSPDDDGETGRHRMRSVSTSPTLLYRGLKEMEKDRPFTIPKGEFRPKQSLGQNFLSDQNYVVKILAAFSCSSKGGSRVVELGPGPGALTRKLILQYPEMTGIEIDQRAVEFLQKKLPAVNILHQDVLKVDWPSFAAEKGGPLSLIGNLPYNITSQILFSLIDSYKAVNKAVVTAQYEVGARIVAKPSTKQYGILSVAFQLYSTPTMNFKIPPTVFYPQPKVQSCLVTLDFTRPHPDLHRVSIYQLRRLLLTAFQQRRKMLRTSLKDLLRNENLMLPERYQEKRPEELSPEDFLRLTMDLFGENILDGALANAGEPIGYADRRERFSPEMGSVVISPDGTVKSVQYPSAESTTDPTSSYVDSLTPDQFRSEVVWRRPLIPYIINNTNALHKNVLKSRQGTVESLGSS